MKKFFKNEEGQDMIEYALLGAFISIVAIAAISAMKPFIQTIYNSISSALDAAS